jgi:hypothetical protein
MSTDKQLELQQKLIGIRLSIQFKEYLIERDPASRRIILDYCRQWFIEEIALPCEAVLSHQCLQWFNELYAINSHSPEKLNDVYDPIWNILHINLSSCFAFQKLINFFLNGTPPSADLR